MSPDNGQDGQLVVEENVQYQDDDEHQEEGNEEYEEYGGEEG